MLSPGKARSRLSRISSWETRSASVEMSAGASSMRSNEA
jgi:hypothetical protein